MKIPLDVLVEAVNALELARKALVEMSPQSTHFYDVAMASARANGRLGFYVRTLLESQQVEVAQ